MVQQEASEATECAEERRVKCFYAKIEKCRHEHKHTKRGKIKVNACVSETGQGFSTMEGGFVKGSVLENLI